MPATMSDITTPKGRRAGKSALHGEITGADAQAQMNDFLPGGRYHLVPLIAVLEKGTNLTPEARRVYTSAPTSAFPGGSTSPIAIVIPTAVLRVTIGFILRVSAGGNIRTFGDEQEALQWLDGQLDKAEPPAKGAS